MDTAAELGCQVTYGKYGDRAVIDSTDRDNIVTNGRWQEIRYSKRNAYITMYGKKIYLHKFMRVY